MLFREGRLALLLALTPVAHAASLEYTVSYEHRLVGSMEVADEGDARRIDYGYSVNGRGPKLRFNFTLDATKLPRTLTVSGLDTLQVAANENLTADHWSSPVDSGGVQPGVFYTPFYESPEGEALLARALLAAKGRSLRLAPAGTAHLQGSQPRRLTDGAKSVSVRLYILTGVQFAPIPLWLTDDAELFARVDSNLAVIRKGWESQVPVLREAQKQIIDGGVYKLRVNWRAQGAVEHGHPSRSSRCSRPGQM